MGCAYHIRRLRGGHSPPYSLVSFYTASKPPRAIDDAREVDDPPEYGPSIIVDGFDVRVTDAGRYVVVQEDGQARPIPVEEYKSWLATQLIREAPTLDEFRNRWTQPEERRELINHLVESDHPPSVLRVLEEMNDYDLYDVLADLGFGLAPRTRSDRVLAWDENRAECHIITVYRPDFEHFETDLKTRRK